MRPRGPGGPGSVSTASGMTIARHYVNALLEDNLGRVWCGTDAGLFRLERRAGQTEPVFSEINLGMPKEAWDDQVVSALLQDWRGDLWVGAGSGLYRRRGEGGVERYTAEEWPAAEFHHRSSAGPTAPDLGRHE